MELYTHDRQCPVRLYSNGDLLVNRGPACWRDTVAFNCEECNLNHLVFPEIFRKEVSDYIRQTIKMRKPLSELISEAIQHRIHGNRDSVVPLLPNLSLARLDVGHTHAFRPMFSDYRPARLQGWPPISRSKSMGRYPPQQGGALEYCGTITTLMLFPAFCSLSAMTGSKVWLLSDKLDPSHQLHVFSIQALQIP
eukprot:XP_024457603.1 uncharacterized protein LOC7476903 [Populus trichocarpa]